MMVNNDIRHYKEKLKFLRKKLVHYQHHAQFSDVCLELQTVPNSLEIRKTPCIRVTDNNFLENWRNILKDAELTINLNARTNREEQMYLF